MNGAGSFAAIAAVAEIELLESGLNLELNGPAQAGAFMSFAHNNGLEGQKCMVGAAMWQRQSSNAKHKETAEPLPRRLLYPRYMLS